MAPSFLGLFKRFLPGFTRRAVHGDIESLRNDMMRQMQYMHDCLHWDIENRAVAEISRVGDAMRAHDTRMMMFAWEQFKETGESVANAKKRFFASLPPATGGMRLYQLASAQLLREFDALCREHNVPYWLCFGTLIGAKRHGGFIPWDDDVDLGMIREDVYRLQEVLNADGSRYRLTLVFDKYVHCRQLRFCYKDESAPCFLDIFYFDWVPALSSAQIGAIKSTRERMVFEMENSEHLAFWSDEPCFPMERVGGDQIDACFEKYLDELRSNGLIAEAGNELDIIWGIDNNWIFREPWFVLKNDDFFPLSEIKFEGLSCRAPRNVDVVLREWYGDYWTLPDDMSSHFQHVDREMLNNPEMKKELESLLAAQSEARL